MPFYYKGEVLSGGSNGKSAYEIAVDNGFEGTEQEWLEGLVGPPGQDGADGSGINNIYSAEEQVVGTYFEKDHYRRVFYFTMPSTTDTYFHPISKIENVDKLVSITGTVKRIASEGGYITQFPIVSSGGHAGMLVYNVDGDQCLNVWNTHPSYVGTQAKAIIEYTKTTDQASQSLASTPAVIPNFDDLDITVPSFPVTAVSSGTGVTFASATGAAVSIDETPGT